MLDLSLSLQAGMYREALREFKWKVKGYSVRVESSARFAIEVSSACGPESELEGITLHSCFRE